MASVLGDRRRATLPRVEARLKYRVDWTVAAVSDLIEIRRYIGHFNPYAASSMAEKIIEAASGLIDFPHRGRAVPGTELRESTLPYPYVIRCPHRG